MREPNQAHVSPTTMTIRRVMAWVMALAAVSMLSGCGEATRDGASGTSPSAASQRPPGLTEPPGKPSDGTQTPPTKPIPADPSDPFSPTVVWKGSTLIVTAFGSSSCPPVATGATVVKEQLLLISFRAPSEQACTDDYAASVSRIAAPEGDIDVQRKVSAVYDLEGAPRWLVDVRLSRPQQD